MYSLWSQEQLFSLLGPLNPQGYINYWKLADVLVRCQTYLIPNNEETHLLKLAVEVMVNLTYEWKPDPLIEKIEDAIIDLQQW